MARPNKSEERRRKLLPLLAEAFSELGYHRSTTAELAAKCDVQEVVLYRLWPNKNSMFVAAIEFLFDRRMEKWQATLAEPSKDSTRAARLIELTSQNLGEQPLYRIVFAALSETDDAEIKNVLRRLYQKYHERVAMEVTRHRKQAKVQNTANDDDTAWALIGLVAFMNIVLDLNLMKVTNQRRFFTTIASWLLNGELP